ncbi:NUCLEAR SPECKLE RNA-BINDING PROTEIN A-RELATED [Salix koriyanagi]|uniref:NUCLEAR SPECKLE RNA-BINDING PROTEIN A-RELATED n=1 Tax=Salix koriyanagi TaxID=2511006 RepID=A0A9Q0QM49_9ROSI|nr:NUCLEAR SPECKLE RNA-BINDING PROTEIN A-RELATED [Salix koriyanagi]
MTDGYWNRQQPSNVPSSGMLKRPRSDYDMPSSYEMQNYYPRDVDDDRTRYETVKDSKTIGSAYDRYLQNAQAPTFASREASAMGGAGFARGIGGGMSGLPIADSAVMTRPRSAGLDLPSNGRDVTFVRQRQEDRIASSDREMAHLPPDATNTLYVEGFPPDCSRREVAHIFRPFVGYKEVRLVSKEARQRGGDPIILCFVDFVNPECAATAMSALQGYKVDEHDPDSRYLRLQFSRHPGPRSGPISRGRR